MPGPGPQLIDWDTPASNAPINLGLRAWYYSPFGGPGQSAASWRDLAEPAGYTGTAALTGAYSWTTTPRGDWALNCSTTGTGVGTVTGNPLAGSAAGTIAAWVSFASISFSPVVIFNNVDGGVGDGWNVSLDGNATPKIQFRKLVGYSGSYIAANAGVAANTWYRVLATVDAAGNGSLYINGVKQTATATYSTSAPAPTTNTVVAQAGGSRDVIASDVRVLARGFTDSDAWQDYVESQQGWPTGLNRFTPATWLFLGKASGGGTFTGAMTLASQSATMAIDATFAPGTKTGTMSLASVVATLTASATFTKPTYTGTLTLVSGVGTLAMVGSHSVPVYTGTLTISSQPATVALSGTFVAPTYTGTLTASSQPASVAMSATFAVNTFTGTLTISSVGAVFAAAATFTAPVYTGTLTITSGAASVSMSATHTVPTYSGTLSLASQGGQFAATATFTAPVYTGTLSIASPAATISMTGTFRTLHTGTLTLTSQSATVAMAGSVTNPVYTGTLTLTSQSAAFAMTAIFATVVYSGSLTLTPGTATVAMSATHSPPVYTGTLTLVGGTPTVAMTGTVSNPSYTGTLAVSSGPAVVAMTGTITPPGYTGVLTMAGGPATISMAAAVTVPVYSGSLTVVSAPAALAMAGVFVAPVFAGTLTLETAPALFAAEATWAETPPTPGEGGEFWTQEGFRVVRVFNPTLPARTFSPTVCSRIYWNLQGVAVGQNVERGDTLYTTKQENKTFGIDFSVEGVVRDGGVLSNPVVTIVKHSSVSGTPTVPVVSAAAEVIPAGTDFRDSDGRKIKGGKGVRVRINSTTATKGKYTLSCVVTVTPPGGFVDTLEGGGVLEVQ